MHRRVASLLIALAVLAVACGAPKSGEFSAIPLGNLPDGLTATTSTTTTATTIVETTTSSTIEAVATTTTVEPIPTTTNPTEQVTLYFVADSGNQLVSSPLYMTSPPQPYLVLLALQKGPDVAGSGLRTAIPPKAKFTKSEFRGVFTVDLSADFFTSMANAADERPAVAQIVLTLTGLRGISTVRFTINDEPITVPLGNGEPSAIGQSLFKEDYEALLGNSAPPTTTTTTTTTTTSVTPPSESVAADPATSIPAGG